MKKIESKDLVVKSNKLIEASYRLTAVEQKIIYKLINCIKKDDKDFKEYTFKISEFMELMDVKDKSKYTELPKITKGLMKKVFSVHSEDEELQISWLSSAKYKKGSGEVTLKFDSNLKPLLLQMQTFFTQIDINNVMQLKSGYSCRIYELLKQYQNIGDRTISVEKLRDILGIEATEYPLYSDFKRNVILQAQKELNVKTDLMFKFEEIKSGRKVTSIKFLIENRPGFKNEIAVTSNFDIDEYIKLLNEVKALIDEDISDNDIKALLVASDNNMELIKAKYDIAKVQTKPINDIVAWLKRAIEEDYQPPVSRKVKHNIDTLVHINKDSTKRKYDVNKLEDYLLGRSHEMPKAE